MIKHLKGKIFKINDASIILDVHDIGFKVTMPVNEISELNEGQELMVYTYLNVKEDLMDLYGSIDDKVMNLFERIIEVSGIGPKSAIGILSKLSVNDLISSIINADVSTICLCPGIGKKTAERLVLELKDKLIKQNITCDTTITKSIKAKEESSTIKDECMEALINLGYKRADSKKIVDKIYVDGISLEELIKKALTK